ncbi:aldehyde dehydrogenase domain-containing protein [Penicillium atrosanguineum]|nr:aldehyde dehydrogenase domain-containing protein [Penicillium atrosanguineum]
MDAITVDPVPLWIDNQVVVSNIYFDVTNAGTGSTTSAHGATRELAERAVDSSYDAFNTWRKTDPWQRRDLFLRAAQILQDKSDAVETPIDSFVASQANIESSIDLLQEIASQNLGATGGNVYPRKDNPGSFAMVVREPLGVNVGIAPWNVSLYLGLRAVAMPIACGNTAILKASEMTPLVHHFIGTLFRDAGFPPGVLNIIQHRREDAAGVLDSLISDERVRKINFTGSTNVGKIVAAKAAMYCKPVLLELGGKSALIVLDDADLDLAVKAAVSGAFTHHGQICMSTERILVADSAFDTFAARMRVHMSEIQDDTHHGASLKHTTKMAAIVSNAIAQGARPLDDQAPKQAASQLTPLILTGVTREMSIWHTETFAPVALMVPFSSIYDAVALANDCSYGLSTSIFTSDILKAIDMARQIETMIGAILIGYAVDFYCVCRSLQAYIHSGMDGRCDFI